MGLLCTTNLKFLRPPLTFETLVGGEVDGDAHGGGAGRQPSAQGRALIGCLCLPTPTARRWLWGAAAGKWRGATQQRGCAECLRLLEEDDARQ
jgi:hypothetical protein